MYREGPSFNLLIGFTYDKSSNLVKILPENTRFWHERETVKLDVWVRLKGNVDYCTNKFIKNLKYGRINFVINSYKVYNEKQKKSK